MRPFSRSSRVCGCSKRWSQRASVSSKPSRSAMSPSRSLALHSFGSEPIFDAEEGVVPRGQVHPHRLRADFSGGLHRDELRRELAKRRPRAARAAVGVLPIRKERDRHLVTEQELVDAVVHVARSFDEDEARLEPLDRVLHEARARGAMVTNADDDDLSVAHEGTSITRIGWDWKAERAFISPRCSRRSPKAPPSKSRRPPRRARCCATSRRISN